MSNMVPGNDKSMDIMRRFLGDDWNGFFNNGLPGFLTGSIRADIKEKENEYIVEAEMPGFTKEQIEIQYENGTLTILARQHNEINENKDKYIRRERHYGELKRSFSIENIQQDQISAQYKDGILHVVLPKDQNKQMKAKRIDIQ